MADNSSSPSLLKLPALLPKKRHQARRRILDPEASKNLRKKINFDENARGSFEEDGEVLYIAESPAKKIKTESSVKTERKDTARQETSIKNTSRIKTKDTSSQSNKNICQLDIGNDHYVVANRFKGELRIHIRVYEKRQDNSTYPTKKGIALDLQKWMKLMTWYADDVDEAIKGYDDDSKDTDLHAHLGCNYFVSVKKGYPVVNIRRWFLPENEENIRPTRMGITLTFGQWDKVKDSMIVLKDLIGDELENVTFCEFSDDHQNQMGMLECSNCNPNGTMYY